MVRGTKPDRCRSTDKPQSKSFFSNLAQLPKKIMVKKITAAAFILFDVILQLLFGNKLQPLNIHYFKRLESIAEKSLGFLTYHRYNLYPLQATSYL
jgi:hypothetical protein